jgi:hypothetical protein
MMDKSDNVESIKQEIEAAIQELEQIKSRSSKILCAEELEKFEKDIAKKTARLAGLFTAKVIQESLDSDEMSQKSSELVKSMPHAMKNQGLRDVSITTASGEVVTVKAAYHTRKKKGRRKKKKS